MTVGGVFAAQNGVLRKRLGERDDVDVLSCSDLSHRHGGDTVVCPIRTHLSC